jgi:hypothetical protein
MDETAYGTLSSGALLHHMLSNQKARVAAAIFDVDGTLLNSVDQHARSWVDAFL